MWSQWVWVRRRVSSRGWVSNSAVELAAEQAQAGAGVEDDDLAVGADFDAGGVAAVVDGGRAGCGDGAADAPEGHARGPGARDLPSVLAIYSWGLVAHCWEYASLFRARLKVRMCESPRCAQQIGTPGPRRSEKAMANLRTADGGRATRPARRPKAEGWRAQGQESRRA